MDAKIERLEDGKDKLFDEVKGLREDLAKHEQDCAAWRARMEAEVHGMRESLDRLVEQRA